MMTPQDILNGAGAMANVEFVSAYPNRPLRAEDAYAAFTGDVLANLLTHCGWQVTREYYVNDAGPQADALARGIFARLTNAEHFEDSETTAITEAVRAAIASDLLQSGEETWLPDVRRAAIAAALASIKADLASLNVRFDVFTPDTNVAAESALPKLLQSFASKGLLTDASGAPLAEAPAKPTGRLMLDTPQLGDARKRPLTGAEGRYTYFAYDLAYHQHKLARGFSLLVDVFRKDYGSYGPGLAAGVSVMSAGKAELQTSLLEPVLGARREDAPPALGELLAYYGAQSLRRLYLSHEAGTPLELACDADTRQALQAAEDTHLAALALPAAQTPEALLEGYAAALKASMTEKTPQSLMAYTDTLATALTEAGAASVRAKAQLTQCRHLLGLT